MGIPTQNGIGVSGTPPSGDLANAVVTGTLSKIGPGDPFSFWGGFNLAVYATINTSLTTTNGSDTATVSSGTGIAIGNSVDSINVPSGTTWKTFSGTTGTLSFPAVTLQNIQMQPNTAVLGNIFYPTSQLIGANVSGLNIPSGGTVLSVVSNYIPGNISTPATPGSVLISVQPIAYTLPLGQPVRFALTNQSITTGVDANALFTGSNLTYSGTINVEKSFNGGKDWITHSVPNTVGTLMQFTAGTPVSIVINEPEKGVVYRINCIAYTSGTIAYRMSANGGAAMSLQATSAN